MQVLAYSFLADFDSEDSKKMLELTMQLGDNFLSYKIPAIILGTYLNINKADMDDVLPTLLPFSCKVTARNEEILQIQDQ